MWKSRDVFYGWLRYCALCVVAQGRLFLVKLTAIPAPLGLASSLGLKFLARLHLFGLPIIYPFGSNQQYQRTVETSHEGGDLPLSC